MLGTEIIDPDGIEGTAGTHAGLGHLDVTTRMYPQKQLSKVRGRDIKSGYPVTGYEIHIGHTDGPDCKNAWLRINNENIGAGSPNGRVRGCYIHGLFNADDFRNSFLSEIGAITSNLNYDETVENTLEKLADHMERYADLDQILEMSGTLA
jgi:adenosylcobyric acid synthase